MQPMSLAKVQVGKKKTTRKMCDKKHEKVENKYERVDSSPVHRARLILRKLTRVYSSKVEFLRYSIV